MYGARNNGPNQPYEFKYGKVFNSFKHVDWTMIMMLLMTNDGFMTTWEFNATNSNKFNFRHMQQKFIILHFDAADGKKNKRKGFSGQK